MSAQRHTPGPWRVERGPFFLQIAADAAEPSKIATIQAVSPGTAAAFANARLIAAATELLAASEAVKAGAVFDPYTRRAYIEESVLSSVRAAIAKAEQP